MLLNLAWAAIDSITGDGINTAAIYHILYGTDGAGYRDYYPLMLKACVVGVVIEFTIGGLILFRKSGTGKSPLLQRGVLIAVLMNLGLSPVVVDILRVLRTGSVARADFENVYASPYILPHKSVTRPNLVYIYAEGLERTYFDENIFPGLIRELRELENYAVSFTGITQVEGTGWTMAGIVASQCGIPLLVPVGAWAGNSMSGMDAYLPRAKGLSDLLKENGYHLCYMGGADIKFAGKDKFLKTHQFDEILGREELLPRLESKKYVNDWGLYDDTLLGIAEKKVEDLSNTQKPFALFILTLDTHHPNGNPSRSVLGTKYRDGSDTMLNAVAGSEALIARFIKRLRQSPAGANTVIVVASDHLAFNSKATALMKNSARRNLFMVIPPNQISAEYITTEGSTLDVASTLLPFLGFRGSIGLGRDLRDKSIDSAARRRLMEGVNQGVWSKEIMALWDFPRLAERIEFDPENESIMIGNRVFKAPALITLSADGTAMLTFEFDSPSEYLAKAVGESTILPFILFSTKKQAPSLLGLEYGDNNNWYLIAGSEGKMHSIIRVDKKQTYTKAQLIASTLAQDKQ